MNAISTPAVSTILLYGSEADLLSLRAEVLQSAGFSVCDVDEFQSLERVLRRERIELLILCHTLLREEAGRAVSLARELWPAIKILSLDRDKLSGSEPAVECLDNFPFPALLIATVCQMLQQECNDSAIPAKPLMVS